MLIKSSEQWRQLIVRSECREQSVICDLWLSYREVGWVERLLLLLTRPPRPASHISFTSLSSLSWLTQSQVWRHWRHWSREWSLTLLAGNTSHQNQVICYCSVQVKIIISVVSEAVPEHPAEDTRRGPALTQEYVASRPVQDKSTQWVQKTNLSEDSLQELQLSLSSQCITLQLILDWLIQRWVRFKHSESVASNSPISSYLENCEWLVPC